VIHKEKEPLIGNLVYLKNTPAPDIQNIRGALLLCLDQRSIGKYTGKKCSEITHRQS